MNTATASYKVASTKNYDKFKPLDGNRVVNELHLKRLIASMKETPLFSPIIVNEYFQVIDGQHRLEACKILSFPVYYIVVDGYGLREVQVLNANNKTWSLVDYLDGYADMGFQDYITARDFMQRNQLPIVIVLAILGKSGNGKTLQDIRNGNFKVRNLAKANRVVNVINEVGAYYPGSKRRNFCLALIKVIDNPKFDVKEFLRKSKANPAMFYDAANVDQYVEMVEDIYNYRSREKVSLKYQ